MSLACATPLSVISRNSAGTSIFGISYFGRPNQSVICFAVLALVAPIAVRRSNQNRPLRMSVMNETGRPERRMAAEEVLQFGPRCNLDAIVPFVGRVILVTHS